MARTECHDYRMMHTEVNERVTLRQKRAQKAWAQLLFSILAASLFGILSFFVVRILDFGSSFDYPGPARLLLFPILLLVVFVVLFVHESGHLIGGFATGFAFSMLIIGPFKIHRERGQLRISLNKSLSLAGGMVSMLPPSGTGLSRRMLVMVAGGPLASLFLAVACCLIAFLLPLDGLWRQFILTLSLFSFIIFIVTALPLRMGGTYSDGARLLTLLGGGPKTERWSAIIILQQSLMGDQRPEFWDRNIIRQATSLPDDSPDHFMGCCYAYYAAVDRGDIEEASFFANLLKEQHTEAMSLVRDLLALELAYFAAYYEHNLQEAQLWYEKGRKVGKTYPYTFKRAEAALKLLEGQREEAHNRAEEGLRALASIDFPSLRLFEERQLRNLLRP